MDSIVQMRLDIEMLKSLVGQSTKVGPVAVIDAKKGYRVKLGEDDEGNDFLSPWLPHPETAKSSVPLKPGDVVGITAPNGDLQQGLLQRGGYSKDHETPNEDMDANVFKDAGVTVTIKDGSLIVSIGGVTFTLSGGGLAINGGTVTHNGTNIGSDHKHIEVMPGMGKSGPPEG